MQGIKTWLNEIEKNPEKSTVVDISIMIRVLISKTLMEIVIGEDMEAEKFPFI
jgi:hypothetical protein